MGDWTSLRQPAELSGLFKPRVVMPVRGDWLVVDAVLVNRSAGPNSLLAGKITGNFANFGPFDGLRRTKCADFPEGCEGIPCAAKQGIFVRLTGNLNRRTGKGSIVTGNASADYRMRRNSRTTIRRSTPAARRFALDVRPILLAPNPRALQDERRKILGLYLWYLSSPQSRLLKTASIM